MVVKKLSQRDASRLLKKAHKYIIKPIPLKAKELEEEVELTLKDGEVVKGRLGDYIVQDLDGSYKIVTKEEFEENYLDADKISRHLVKMNDYHNSLLNVSLIAKSIVQIFDNPKKKVITILFTLPGKLEKVRLYYLDEKVMKKEKQFLEALIRKFRAGLFPNIIPTPPAKNTKKEVK